MKIGLTSTNPIGFRLSLIDILALCVTLAIMYLYPKDFLSPSWLNNLVYWSIPFVVGNFFLFCNVFRVRTRYELCWCVVALLNLAGCLYYYHNAWSFFITQFSMTFVVILLEVKSSKYHGIFAKARI